MAITDTTYQNLTSEVRVLQIGTLQAIPNRITASEELADGMFVMLGADQTFEIPATNHAATHLVLKSGEPRLTAIEIANNMGRVLEGEPVMALGSGSGTVSIPFAQSITSGEEITVNVYGYAVPRSGSACYVVGVANEDVTVQIGAVAFGEAVLSLPATYRP